MVLDKMQLHKQTYAEGKLVGDAREIVGRTPEGTYFHLRCVRPCKGAKARVIQAGQIPAWARPHLLQK